VVVGAVADSESEIEAAVMDLRHSTGASGAS
jgi:hypothetical protein